MRVVFAAGGTGGHLYPAIAIANEVKKRNDNILFLISDRGIEREVLKPLGYNFYEQKISAFVGKGFFSKIMALIKIKLAVFKVWKFVKKGDKVLLMGGFVSAPIAIVAKLKGVDIYLHEQNSRMGLVNSIFAKLSKKVFLSFEIKGLNLKNATVVGNPVRAEFHKIEVKRNYEKRLLIVGGSQGSRVINNCIIDASDELIKNGFTIKHMCGKRLYKECVERYGSREADYKGRLEVLAYIDDFAKALSEADIVISRAGSGAIFEILSASRPAIFIPFKEASQNHQYYNAKLLLDDNLATMIEEDNLSKDSLIKRVAEVEKDLKGYQERLAKVHKMNAEKVIAEEILS